MGRRLRHREFRSAPASIPAADRPANPAGLRRRVVLTVAGLLGLHVALAANSLVQENPTIDEVIHLPAGITYWQTGTFKLYHHNPPLIKLVAALPALASQPVMGPLYRSSYWPGDHPNKAGFAHEFAWHNADDYFELFARCRLLMPLFSALGGLVVFAWSSRLYGTAGGLLSLALWAFCPNILAHGRLITTDIGATALGVGATYLFWVYLKSPTWGRAMAAGLALGAAELAKFSMLLLYAVWPVLWLLHALPRRDLERLAARVGRAVAQGALMVGLSVLVIDIGYAFEGLGVPLGRYEFACRTLTRPVDSTDEPSRGKNDPLALARSHRVNRFRGTWLGGLPTPLPKHYVLGFDEQKLESEGLPASWSRPDAPEGATIGYPVYLDGVLRESGWWSYYFKALAYKVPEGTLALVGLSLLLLVVSRSGRAPWPDEITLLVIPTAVLVLMSLGTDINLGLRYVLPAFPYLFIAAGRLMPWASDLAGRRSQFARALIAACLLETVAGTITIHPHYLAYFNWASGGPEDGSAHLIDSNLDWGQDLVGLERWLKANAPGERVGLAYFGQINPSIFARRDVLAGEAREGFDWFLPPPRPGSMPKFPKTLSVGAGATRLQPGLYAISASLLRGLPWRVYDPSRLAPWEARMHAYSYFGELTPIASIGHSIFIYRVTSDEARRLARQWSGPGQPATPRR